MTPKFQPSFIAWRFYLILSIIFLAVFGLILRVLDLAIIDKHFLQQQGDERVLRLMIEPSLRGMITDRNGYPLAVSTPVYSAWINPREFAASRASLKSLGQLLEMKPKEILMINARDKNRKREFTYLKRGLSPDRSQKIKALGITGLYLQEEYKRYYPEGEVTAHVIGYTNVDDQGQEGLELGYNDWLKGEPGKRWVIKDRLGRVISDVQRVQEQQPGHDLVLSIDRRIQYIAYRELMAGVIENKAASGSAIVLDTRTGEILAMVNQPSYNPNNRPEKMTDAIRNRAVTDTFEPGSTIKAFSVASALDSGHFKADSVIDTSPGWIRVGHNVVMDHSNNGLLTVTQILQKSSNVGVTKMILSLSPNQLWSLLHRVGFGESTNVNFPGEQSGSLVKHDPWGQFTLATLAFGYGVSVTPLQLARAYLVLADNGEKKPVSLLKVNKPVTGPQVMDPKITREMLTLLESVVEKGGTGTAANVPGYRVAGKTGTAKLVGKNGYEKHRYTSMFIGLAPLTNPRFVVAVVIHDPQGKHYYGGTVSGPVFSKIMESALRLYDVPPDDVKS